MDSFLWVLFLEKCSADSWHRPWEVHWCHWWLWAIAAPSGESDLWSSQCADVQPQSTFSTTLKTHHYSVCFTELKLEMDSLRLQCTRWGHVLWQTVACGRHAEDRVGSHRFCEETPVTLRIPKDSSQRIMSPPTRPEGARSTKMTGSRSPPRRKWVKTLWKREERSQSFV